MQGYHQTEQGFLAFVYQIELGYLWHLLKKMSIVM